MLVQASFSIEQCCRIVSRPVSFAFGVKEYWCQEYNTDRCDCSAGLIVGVVNCFAFGVGACTTGIRIDSVWCQRISVSRILIGAVGIQIQIQNSKSKTRLLSIESIGRLPLKTVVSSESVFCEGCQAFHRPTATARRVTGTYRRAKVCETKNEVM